LDKPPRELNLPESQYWIYPGFDTSAGIDNIKAMPTLEYALDKLTPKDMTPIFVGNPSDKDSTWSQHHPNTTVLELLTLGPRWEWFDKYNAFDKTTNSHGPDFELSKRRYADKMWERTVQVLNSYGAELPHSLDDVGHFEIGSPLSFTHYYEASRGALYGLDHDVQRFECKNYFLRLRPEVQEVSGLFLSGQDVVADSLVGAMMGGLLCAQKVLGFVNPLSLVRTSGKAKKSCFFAKADQVQPISVEDVYLNYPYGYY
jgi:all-trans-retinol 13,14-reductase